MIRRLGQPTSAVLGNLMHPPPGSRFPSLTHGLDGLDDQFNSGEIVIDMNVFGGNFSARGGIVIIPQRECDTRSI